LNDRERVEWILYQLHEEHRWTIKDLLHHIVTENSSSGAPTQAKRINDLSKAVLNQETVIQAITRGTQDLELDLLVGDPVTTRPTANACATRI
jgi:hypothetical protein